MISENEQKTETVFSVGAEGGSVDLEGCKFPSGQWEFTVHTSNIWSGDPNIGGSAPKIYGPVTTWDEAINLFSQAQENWIWYHAGNVHPEFRQLIEKEITQRIGKLPPEERSRWEDTREQQWRQVLDASLPPPPYRPSGAINLPVGWNSPICQLEYKRWYSMAGESGRDITLLAYQDDQFKNGLRVWSAPDSSKVEEDPQVIAYVLKLMENDNWKVVEQSEGKSSSTYGGESWKKYTLHRTMTEAEIMAAKLRKFD